jgi:hypothetical protein
MILTARPIETILCKSPYWKCNLGIELNPITLNSVEFIPPGRRRKSGQCVCKLYSK